MKLNPPPSFASGVADGPIHWLGWSPGVCRCIPRRHNESHHICPFFTPQPYNHVISSAAATLHHHPRFRPRSYCRGQSSGAFLPPSTINNCAIYLHENEGTSAQICCHLHPLLIEVLPTTKIKQQSTCGRHRDGGNASSTRQGWGLASMVGLLCAALNHEEHSHS